MIPPVEAALPAPARLWSHMRALWPRWTLLPTAPFIVYCLVMIAIGDARWDHVVMMVLLPFLAYYSEKTKRLFTGGSPIALVALCYDFMRYIRNVGVSVDRVHNCDLRGYELALFGIDAGGGRITLHDYFLTHHWDWLDVYCAIPYGAYIFAVMGCAVVLWRRDYRAVQRFTWAFFLMNVVAFVTYHVYPAAPPWYYHSHGCVIDMAANPEPGPRLTHVDALLGISYFHGLYSRSSDIYGAMPSLHVAYPLLILVEGWRLFRLPGRIFAVVFFLSMSFAAVYLDHHWVVDVVVGYGYCLASMAAVHAAFKRLAPASEPQVAAATA